MNSLDYLKADFGRETPYEIKPGDEVISFDFPANSNIRVRRGCYVRGTVEAIEETRYVTRVTEDVYNGVKRLPLRADTVMPPVNGFPSLFDSVTCGVIPAEVFDVWTYMGLILCNP